MRALHALFALLRRYGPSFAPSLWALVYSGVLLPIFDDVRHVSEEGTGGAGAGGSRDLEASERPMAFSMAEFTSGTAVPVPSVMLDADSPWGGSRAAPSPSGGRRRPPVSPAAAAAAGSEEHEWLRTTCMPALSSLVRLQTRFFRRLRPLLPSLLSLIESCIDQEIEGLARIGVACLRQLLAEGGPRFDTAAWDAVTAGLARLFAACTPTPLVAAREVLLGPLPGTADAAGGAGGGAAGGDETFSDGEEGGEGEEHDIEEYIVGQEIGTPYGDGEVIGARAADHVLLVRLPWGTASLYVHDFRDFLASAKADVQAAEAAERAAAAAAAEAAKPPPPPAPAPAPAAPAGPKVLPFNSMRVVTQCVVQLELITSVGVLADAHLDSLTERHVQLLLRLLQDSADFARAFNADRALRRALWDAGFMRFARHNKLPSLLRQETAATQQLLILLLRLFSYTGSAVAGSGSGGGSPWRALAVVHLRDLARSMVARYTQLAIEVERARLLATPAFMHASVHFSSAAADSAARARAGPLAAALSTSTADLLDGGGNIDRDLFREAAAYGPLVARLLEALLGFDDAQFTANLDWLYPLLTGLIVAGNGELRALVAHVFDTRLRGLLALAVPSLATPVGGGAAAAAAVVPAPHAARDVAIDE